VKSLPLHTPPPGPSQHGTSGDGNWALNPRCLAGFSRLHHGIVNSIPPPMDKVRTTVRQSQEQAESTKVQQSTGKDKLVMSMLRREDIPKIDTPMLDAGVSIEVVRLVSYAVNFPSRSTPRGKRHLLSTKQPAEPAFRLGRLLLDRLVELVNSSVELLARLLELLLGAMLEVVELRLGPLCLGFCVIGLGTLAHVSMAVEQLWEPRQHSATRGRNVPCSVPARAPTPGPLRPPSSPPCRGRGCRSSLVRSQRQHRLRPSA
jgi:hypothetical protein